MSHRSILFPDPSEQIKPEINLFPRKISYDYEDFQNQKEQENIIQNGAIYNPVQVKNFEEWNKSKCYTNYFVNPTVAMKCMEELCLIIIIEKCQVIVLILLML